jgi:hypothetical protein
LPEVIFCQENSFIHFPFARSSPYNVRGSLFKDPYIGSSDLLAKKTTMSQTRLTTCRV